MQGYLTGKIAHTQASKLKDTRDGIFSGCTSRQLKEFERQALGNTISGVRKLDVFTRSYHTSEVLLKGNFNFS